ncbi:MAG: PDZ domain-containing protein [Gemmatimonadales bacterium]|nr:PDZ domain-containing protein [Gemmatimonadales bacterium]
MILGVRLLGFAAAALPAAAQGLPPSEARFPAGRAAVELPFEQEDGFVIIRVSVAGAGEFRLVLDTGSPVVVLADTARASRMGLQIAGLAQVGGEGDGPMTSVPLAVGVSLDAAGVAIRNAVALVGGVDRRIIAGADGVIGGPIFDNCVVEIDWTAKVVRLHDPKTFTPTKPGVVLPLERRGDGHAYTRGTIDVTGGAPISAVLHLDTGARQAIGINPDAQPGLRVPAKALAGAIVAWGSRGPARGDMARIARVELGGLVLRDVVTSFKPGARPGSDGWIGLEALRRFTVLIDYPNGRLILGATERMAEPFRFTTTGLYLTPGGTELSVADVMAGSPAEEAGLRIGDVITAVDGRPVARSEAADILVMPAAGTPVTVTVRRGAAALRLLLHPRTLL